MTDGHDTMDAADRTTVLALERVLPRVSPSQDRFERILAEIRPEATVVPLSPGRWRRARVAAPTIVALAAAAVITLAFLIARSGGPAGPDARAAITGKSDTAVSGEALLYGSSAPNGTVRVTLRDVPPAPSGHHYEVWVLRRGGAEMEAIGSFAPSSRTVELELPLPGAGDYAAVDVSVEEDGGSPLHSDTSLASGSFS